MAHDPVAGYLEELRRQLRMDPWLARRVLQEVADHLAESADQEQRAGADTAEARRRAVERFGPAAEFAAQLPKGDAVLRLLTLASASGSVAVGLLVAWIVVFVLPAENADQMPFWTVVSCGFLGYGALTWLYFSTSLGRTFARVLALGSASAIFVGLTAIVHSLYLARVTGDWEAYVTIFGLVLAGHGAVLTAYLWRGERALRASSTATSMRS
jgi:hypothetical protein